MKSKTTPAFRRAYRKLPDDIRTEAKKAYKLWKANPFHPGLNFELISAEPPPPLWSVRITLHYRALGIRQGDTVTWVWIGDHREDEKRIQFGRSSRSGGALPPGAEASARAADGDAGVARSF